MEQSEINKAKKSLMNFCWQKRAAEENNLNNFHEIKSIQLKKFN
tara:strand:+ start:254 stop:385 length:132 start_codon:yes stop_codon:yes gene_type:complete